MSAPVHLAAALFGTAEAPEAALGAPDGIWTANSGNANWTHRWQFDSADLEGFELFGPQSLSLRLRRSGTGNGTCALTRITLIDAGDADHATTIFSGSHIPPQDLATGADLVVEFGAALLRSGAGVEIELATTGSGGGPNANAIQLDAISWVPGRRKIVGTPLQVHNGSVWQRGELKRHDGSAWVPARLKRFTAPTWEIV